MRVYAALAVVTNDDSRVLVLRRYLSPERLGPYVDAAGGLGRAEEMYGWNLAISAAFYEVLGALEVTLRNALHTQLTAWHGKHAGAWYDDPRRVLSDKSREDIVAVRDRVRRLGRPQTPGRVVAELGFGFWRFLLASQYERRCGPRTCATHSRSFGRSPAARFTTGLCG